MGSILLQEILEFFTAICSDRLMNIVPKGTQNSLVPTLRPLATGGCGGVLRVQTSVVFCWC